MIGNLNANQIESVLLNNVIGRIGCYANDRVYVVPVTYAYDGSFIIGHTAEGLKIRMLRDNPACCFEVDQADNMSNWQSVISWGTFEELQGEEAEKAMKLFIDRLMPLVMSETSLPQNGMSHTHKTDSHDVQPVIYRIRLQEKTGRFEKRS
jgi:nitroimidazol reductase NimA-like FMN-containing flavoprotein (pyridoxamine 5'-phosphate oxidase superfamily)